MPAVLRVSATSASMTSATCSSSTRVCCGRSRTFPPTSGCRSAPTRTWCSPPRLHARLHVRDADHSKSDPRQPPIRGAATTRPTAFAEREAKAMDAALFVAEFGNDPSDDDSHPHQRAPRAGEAPGRLRLLDLEGERGEADLGHVRGHRRAPSAASDTPRAVASEPARERLLARSTRGRRQTPTLTYHYDSDTGAFTLQANGRAGDAPDGGLRPARGHRGGDRARRPLDDRSVTPLSDGGRLVSATPSGGGFTIAVAAAPRSL